MEIKKYRVFALKALTILKIKISNEEEDLDNILKALRAYASSPDMGRSDISVHEQVRELVKAIELKKSANEITNILKKLEDETQYRDYWD